MADVGTGCTITWGTSTFSPELLDLSQGDIARTVVDISDMGTTGARRKMAGDLYDAGELEVEILFDPDDVPPVTAAAETITITFPVPAGKTTGAKVAGTGFISNWRWGAPLEDRMTASFTITWDGATDPAWTDSVV